MFVEGDMVRVRGRDWVVLEGSSEEFLMLAPLKGDEWETTGVLLSLEAVEKIEAPTPDPVIDADAQVESLRGLLASFVRRNFTREGKLSAKGWSDWSYMHFGAGMVGNMLLGALSDLGYSPEEELQRAMEGSGACQA